MRHQFRASNGKVMHLQTTPDFLGVHCPGADRMELTVEDIDRLTEHLAEARHDLIAAQVRRTR